jgi:hypothetical protein
MSDAFVNCVQSQEVEDVGFRDMQFEGWNKDMIVDHLFLLECDTAVVSFGFVGRLTHEKGKVQNVVAFVLGKYAWSCIVSKFQVVRWSEISVGQSFLKILVVNFVQKGDGVNQETAQAECDGIDIQGPIL